MVQNLWLDGNLSLKFNNSTNVIIHSISLSNIVLISCSLSSRTFSEPNLFIVLLITPLLILLIIFLLDFLFSCFLILSRSLFIFSISCAFSIHFFWCLYLLFLCSYCFLHFIHSYFLYYYLGYLCRPAVCEILDCVSIVNYVFYKKDYINHI